MSAICIATDISFFRIGMERNGVLVEEVQIVLAVLDVPLLIIKIVSGVD